MRGPIWRGHFAEPGGFRSHTLETAFLLGYDVLLQISISAEGFSPSLRICLVARSSISVANLSGLHSQILGDRDHALRPNARPVSF